MEHIEDVDDFLCFVRANNIKLSKRNYRKSDKNKECQRRYATSEKARAASKKYQATARGRANILITGARRRSVEQGLDFDLDQDWVVTNWTDKCPILDIEYSMGKGKMDYNSRSIDRIDPDKGYTKDNCRIVSILFNRMKNEMTDKELVMACKSVLEKLG